MKLGIYSGTAFAASLLLAACGSGESQTAGTAESSVDAEQPESAGSVTGTIGDEQVDLYVVPSQSDQSSSHLSLYILGEGLRERDLGSLMIGAEWSGELGGDFSSADVTIGIPGTSPARVYYGSQEEGLVLTVTNSSLNGETLELTGTVEGTLTAMDLTGHRNPDPQDTLDVNLSFEATVNPI